MVRATRRTFLRSVVGSLIAGPLLTACGSSTDVPTTTAPAGSSGLTVVATTSRSTPAAASGRVRIGYLPITDAAPLLLAHAQGYYQEQGLEADQPTMFRSWSQISEALQARQVDVVHLLMPVSIWMRFGQQVPVKLVAWDHVNGSALTVAKKIERIEDLAGKTIAVPFWYSIHNVLIQLLLDRAGLQPILRGDPSPDERTVKLVVMSPSDMAPALANGSIAGYIVAEPFNALAEVQGAGKILRFSGDVWLDHACCVVVMHEEDVATQPEWAQAVVTAIVRAQRFARENRAEAARLLAKEGGRGYLPQPLEAIERVLLDHEHDRYVQDGVIHHPDWGAQRIDFRPYPFQSYTVALIEHLRRTRVEGDAGFLTTLDPAAAHAELVDDRFVRQALDTEGGPVAFDLPETLMRSERIEP
ncbi:MAG: ABC transporter substrate-binding protein [Thermorudis peleae]|nr:ABC transporter substrate-binding protein [Thermorudis peleae]